MITLKRSLLVFLVIVALICGAFGAVMVSGFNISEFTNGMGKGGHYMSAEEYEDYQYLLDTYGKLDSLRNYIIDNYYTDVDEDALETGMLRGIFSGLNDPYSFYMTEDEYEDVLISLTGDYDGIGVTITGNEDGYVEVVTPTDDSPADKAGLRTGDIIAAVDGEEFTGAEVDLAAAAIRGDAGTSVTLTVLRGAKQLEFNIVRAHIVTQTIKTQMLDGNIGMIRIASFEESTYDDFKAALEDMESKNVKGLVIDLRDNPGGLVDSCINIADLLMDKATVVYTEDNHGNREYQKTKDGKTDLPYVLLVNGGTASSAEILTAGIQDNGTGAVVGTTTFGKGIIQTLDEFTEHDAVKLTILQYFSPNGNVIHGKGIEPDYVVELLDEDYDEDGNIINDKQLTKAIDILNE